MLHLPDLHALSSCWTCIEIVVQLLDVQNIVRTQHVPTVLLYWAIQYECRGAATLLYGRHVLYVWLKAASESVPLPPHRLALRRSVRVAVLRTVQHVPGAAECLPHDCCTVCSCPSFAAAAHQIVVLLQVSLVNADLHRKGLHHTHAFALLLQEARTLAVNNVELGQWHGATPGLPVVYFAAAETQAPSVPVMSADVIKPPKA